MVTWWVLTQQCRSKCRGRKGVPFRLQAEESGLLFTKQPEWSLKRNASQHPKHPLIAFPLNLVQNPQSLLWCEDLCGLVPAYLLPWSTLVPYYSSLCFSEMKLSLNPELFVYVTVPSVSWSFHYHVSPPSVPLFPGHLSFHLSFKLLPLRSFPSEESPVL